jgi:pimeloyl-ACP methyl ester carboxylesterase
LAFTERLWRDWSPGYDAGEHLTRVKQSLQQAANLKAAIDYYRAAGIAGASEEGGPHDLAEQAVWRPMGAGERLILYLHGRTDGCVRAELVRDALHSLPPGSCLVTVPDAGHFLHLEQPDEVTRHIMAWLTG